MFCKVGYLDLFHFTFNTRKKKHLKYYFKIFSHTSNHKSPAVETVMMLIMNIVQ